MQANKEVARERKALRFVSAQLELLFLVIEFLVVIFAWTPGIHAALLPILQWVLDQFWWLALIYMCPQLLETSRRDSEDWVGFGVDNGLAFFAIVAGAMFLVSPWSDSLPVLARVFIFRATILHLFDFSWGVLFALRIAFAGKERGY